MTDLLSHVLAAHGGLDRWREASRITARVAVGGPFWAAKGWPEIVRGELTVTADAHRQHVVVDPFPQPGLRAVLDVDGTDDGADAVRIVAEGESVRHQRQSPRSGFPAPADDASWDAVQVAYFAGCAAWNYLTTPFVFANPGVTAREIDPWTENGHTWRRLAVSFPPTIAGHNTEQVFYYDDAFMQRRLDYQPDVTGTRIAHYTDEPRSFDGFVFYTKRSVHPRDGFGAADRESPVITLDISAVRVE